MSVKDNIHFPDHVDLKKFLEDYSNKEITASKIQEKYGISPRQYRLIVRYFREELNYDARYYKSPKSEFIYQSYYGLYVIRKRKDGVFKYFGTYKTLEEAESIRDKLIENSWDENCLKVVD